MKEKILGFYKLLRVHETTMPFLGIAILGILVSGFGINKIGWLMLAIAVNWLIFVSSFVVNDIADAEEDAMDPKKVKRNPISAKQLSKLEGYIFLGVILLIISVVLFFFSFEVMALGFFTTVVGLIYSLWPIRLKRLPIVDVLSHAFFLGAGEVLFFMLMGEQGLNIFSILVVVGSASISLSGDLFNEIRDWDVDRKSGHTNTVSILGLETSKLLRSLFNKAGYSLAAVGIIGLIVQILL